jgi:cystathionine gamma-synthase
MRRTVDPIPDEVRPGPIWCGRIESRSTPPIGHDVGMERDDGWRDETWLVSGGRPAAPGQPLNTPIVPASNFELDGDVLYSRTDTTPTWHALEAVVGGLERAECVSFASGMAAVSSVFALLPVGSHIAVPSDCYQATAGIAAEGEANGVWTVTRIPTADTDGWIRASADADLVWVESPSNPLLEVADLRRIAAAARRPGALFAVDNTFATALNQRPLDIGADMSVQSATKFIGGHSDLLSGVVTTRSPALVTRLRRSRTLHGGTPGALESYLAVRGARTMALRLARGQASAMTLARRLAECAAVERVRYPGLPGDPGYHRARDQMHGFGSIVSFELATWQAAHDAVRRTRLIRHATSLGSVESTMEQRAVLDGQEGIPAGLIRLSVGVEHVDDLWADLAAAIG